MIVEFNLYVESKDRFETDAAPPTSGDPVFAAVDASPDGWGNFILGPENELAYRAACSLSRGAGNGVSPLVIHGPSGVGKSRILEELAADFAQAHSTASIMVLSAEALLVFRDLDQLQSSQWKELRTRFRESQMIVLDDLHALRNCNGVWDELKHVLDNLDDQGAVLAVSARTAPNLWSNWPRRLVDRFTAGLSIAVGLPSDRSLASYIGLRCRQLGLEPPQEPLVKAAGARLTYRHIDGLLARAKLQKSSMILDSVPHQEVEETVPAMLLEAICKRVADHFGVSLFGLKSRSRRRELVEPRHLAMYLARTSARLSLSAIGSFFSNRDRTSVRHACESSMRRIASEPQFAAAAHMLQSSLESIPVVEPIC